MLGQKPNLGAGAHVSIKEVKSVAAGSGKPASATAGPGHWKAAMSTKDHSKKGIAMKGAAGPTRGHSPARSNAPLLGRKSVLMGMLTSGFVAANVARPSSAGASTIKAIAATQTAYVSKWAPAMAYTIGQQVISPSNDVVSANAAHTSSTTYAADMARWSLSCTFARQEVFVNVLTA